MATAAQSLRFAARRCRCRFAVEAPQSRTVAIRRAFSSSPSRLADDVEAKADTTSKSAAPPVQEATLEAVIKPVERSQELESAFAQLIKDYGHQVRSSTPPELREALPFREPRLGRTKSGLLNLNPTPADMPEEDPEFEEDDITSLAHGELEQHREFRHYARLAAWEMPLLTKLAKPFVPPNQKEVLRFRYTTYMGESHPAEKKVVVEFSPSDMPDLSPVQLEKLKKLCGVRYNPESDIVKMSCEMFESQAQNKRYLGDLVDTLLREARDSKDTFEDIPLDTRHHTFKSKPKFPVEWRMTAERKAELEAARQQAIMTDEQRALEGSVVDGVKQIETAFLRKPELETAAPVAQTVAAGKGAAKGKKTKQRA